MRCSCMLSWRISSSASWSDSLVSGRAEEGGLDKSRIYLNIYIMYYYVWLYIYGHPEIGQLKRRQQQFKDWLLEVSGLLYSGSPRANQKSQQM